MIMLVDTRTPKSNRPLSTFWFFVISLAPWAVMLWLVWPRR
jgi:hypothetical protein